MTKENITPQRVNLSIIDGPSKDIPVFTQDKARGKNYINYGEDNRYPNYLYELYSKSPILSSIIQGIQDFVMGNGISINPALTRFIDTVNSKGDTLEDIIKRCTFDYATFGGFCLQGMRDKNGELAEIYWIDFQDIRINENETKAFYSSKWGTWGAKAIEYPIFNPSKQQHTFILYFKGHKCRHNQVYPQPSYMSAITDIECNVEISKFHLNSILNNFNASAVISFCNGEPDTETKKKIENAIKNKFCGADNANKFMINFAESKDRAVTVERLGSDDFDNRYQNLMKTTRENIYAAFRAIPQLFGLMSESTGFNSQEFAESFKLFNKTSIKPIQDDIQRVFNRLFGVDNSIIFTPFSLEDATKKIEE